jgi:predicted ribosome quality control (RQC) complex YloA/Tae2 family protein
MNAADINCIVRELQEATGSRVDKIFQDKSGMVRIRFYGGPPGRLELLMEAGRRIHSTTFRRKAPQQPSSFAMYLRKHLGNRRLEAVRQHDFDRIVILDFGDLRLLIELFARGNIILLDSETKVMLSLKRSKERADRGEVYVFPDPPASPLSVEGVDDLSRVLRRDDLVRSLAVDLGLGRLYANELCEATGLERTRPPSELSDSEVVNILSWLARFRERISGGGEPVYYLDADERPVEFAPFPLVSLSGSKVIRADSLNQAADVCYAGEETLRLEGRAVEETSDEKDRLKKRLGIQQAQLRQLTEKAERYRELGDGIFANFATIDNVLKELSREENTTEAAIKGSLKRMEMLDAMVRYEPKDKILVLRVGNLELPLNLRRSTGENASAYYDKAKDLEGRAEGARLAIMETKRELASLPSRIAEPPLEVPSRARESQWYESYRWFFSSNGLLVLAGRDAGSNESLVRRYLDPEDLYIHADAHGAPSTIIRAEGAEIPEETIAEACQEALIHSSIWKSGTTAGDAYWVVASQVTKRPTSGEFVPRGAFVIRGKRNYLRGIEASCGIGWYEGRFMCGPLSAVEHHCGACIEIKPGDRKKSEIAKEIIASLTPQSETSDLDQVIQVLPSGRLRIA